MMSGIRNLGMTATQHSSADISDAWAFIRSNCTDGRPCIICTDQWGHWVCVIGVVGTSVIIADPTFTRSNRTENGVHVMSRTKLSRRWRCPNQDRPFYAIAVGK